MTELLLLGPQMLYFFLPVAFANMAPVLFQHVAPFLAKPIDGGKSIGGKRIFGDHKTWRGLIFATIAGGVMFWFQVQLIDWAPTTIGWSPFDLRAFPLWFGLVFGLGAIVGDAIESFAKRRFDVAPGQPWIPFDQIDFLLGSTIVASIFVDFTFAMIVWVFGAGILGHMLVNRIGYWLKLEDSKW